jgi:hypothetical protein
MSRDANQALAAKDEARKNTYTGMITNTMNNIPSDYSAKQKADITTAELGGVDTGYANLRDEMMRRSAATGTTGGLPETMLESNREAIQTKAQDAAQLQETFANVPVQRQLQKASIFQPATSGMLGSNFPQATPSSGTAAIGAGATVGAAALMAF